MINYESGLPKSKEEYLIEKQNNEKIIRRMYGNDDRIDRDFVYSPPEALLNEEIIDFGSMLQAVIECDQTIEVILKGYNDERIAISDFIIQTSTAEVETLFRTLPQDLQDKYLDDDGRDDLPDK